MELDELDMLRNVAVSDDTRCGTYTESFAMFKETATVLNKLVALLGPFQDEGDTCLVMNKPPSKFFNSRRCKEQDRDELFRRFTVELATKGLAREMDVSSVICSLLSNCLSFISVQLRMEKCTPDEIYGSYLEVKSFILTFSTGQGVPDGGPVKKLISSWISDLFGVITGADGMRTNYSHLKIFTVVRLILKSLSQRDDHCYLVLTSALQRCDCALTYYAANREFASYIAAQTSAIEYLLWILKEQMFRAIQRGVPLDKLEISKTLRGLRQCTDKEDSVVLKNVISDILKLA
ncbi:uncharacterized protein [Euwallacea fornicatus]|uniref:uncharacterized protein n=1 Tax=Euwallacea fornicatus TaxID=995702 RepID=UPI00338FA178